MKNRLLFPLVAVLFITSSASAQAWLWGAQGSTGKKTDLFACNVATNPTGNVYHTGGFETSLTFGSTTLTANFEDAFLVKYGQNGNLLWATQSKSLSGAATGYGVASDDSDNAYVSGTVGDTTSFGTYTLYSQIMFLVKYDAAGKVKWAKQPVGFNIYRGYAVATDKFGHEYVTGDDAILLKYDRNGNLKWGVKPKSNNIDNTTFGYSVVTDNSGNIYVSGQFQDSLKFGTYALYSALSSGINGTPFIAKYDSNGNVLWAQQAIYNNTGPSFFTPYAGFTVATDNSGAAYLTGAFSDSIRFGSYRFETSELTTNFFVTKYNPGGTLAWAEDATFIGNNNIGGCGTYSISNDGLNHIYISGSSGEGGQSVSFVFSNDTINLIDTSFETPTFLMKLDSSGHALCYSTISDGGEEPNSAASDSTGNFVYLGGGYEGTVIIGKDTLNDNSGGENTFVGRWQSCNECDFIVGLEPGLPNICSGQSVKLVANGGATYTWSPSTALNTTTGATVIADPLQTTTYTIYSTSGACSDSGQFVVIVRPTPTIQVSPPSTSICKSQSTDLVATGADTYQWSPATGLNATSGDGVLAAPTVTTTYTIIGTTNGCLDTIKDIITVNQNLNVQVTPSSATICSNHGTTLVATGAAAYQWSPPQGLNALTGDSVIANPSVTTTYTLVGSNGSCTDTVQTIITVKPGADVQITSNTPIICQYQSASLVANGATNYQWSPSAGLNTTTGDDVIANPSVTTTYTIIGSIGGCADTVRSVLNVIPAPSVNIVSSASSICQYQSASMVASGATTYEWFPATGLNTISGDSVVATPSITTTYLVIGENSFCADTVQSVITVKQSPNMQVTPSSPIICQMDSINMMVNGAAAYEWFPSAGLNTTTGDSVIVKPSVTTTYSIIGTTNSCSDTVQTVVTVNPFPNVQVIPSSFIICTYSGATLLASGAINYQWYPSTGLNTTTGDSIIADPTINTTYTVVGSNGIDCNDSAQVTVSIIPAPNVPTITIHGDTLISSAKHYNQWFLNDSLLVGDTSDILIINGHKGYYFVEVTNPANGCSTNSDSTTSINQLSVISEQLSIYPNPFNNTIFIKISSAVGNIDDWSLKLTDVLGRMVYTKPSLNYDNEIDLSNLTNGVYFISVTDKTDRAVVPVVKQ